MLSGRAEKNLTESLTALLPVCAARITFFLCNHTPSKGSRSSDALN